MEAITTAASQAMLNVALGIIALLGAYGVYFVQKAAAKVQAQTAQIKDTAARNLIENAIKDTETLTLKAVGAMEQTTAAALREAVKNGTADRESLLALGEKVFNSVKAELGPDVQDTITDNLCDFDTYLRLLIEDTVMKVKNGNPSPAANSQ
jgi:type II secretory pathway pseudopilin PulG|nr:MAG TPA: hypothetical protein [Caudoviricetes sp.]